MCVKMTCSTLTLQIQYDTDGWSHGWISRKRLKLGLGKRSSSCTLQVFQWEGKLDFRVYTHPKAPGPISADAVADAAEKPDTM